MIPTIKEYDTKIGWVTKIDQTGLKYDTKNAIQTQNLIQRKNIERVMLHRHKQMCKISDVCCSRVVS